MLVLLHSLYSQDKKAIAVLDFEGLGVSETDTKALTNRLRGNLVNTGEYQVVERGRMNEILQEQGFQLSECTSNECMVEAGQLLGVEFMLAGSISLVGSTYSVELRFIDVESGKIEKSASYDMRGEIDDLLTAGMQKAVDILLEKVVLPTASIVITTEPKGANVIIGDMSKGKTPLNLTELAANEPFELTITKEWYNSYSEQITLEPGKNNPISIILFQKTGWLSISGSPDKAKLFLDKKSIGRIPLEKIEYPVGTWKLIAKLPEFKTVIKTIEIRDNEVSDVDMSLKPIPKKASVLLSIFIPGGGQYYQNHFIKGTLFIAATIGLGYITYSNHSDLVDYESDYNERLEIYNNNHNLPELLHSQREAVHESFDLMKNAESNRNIFLGALGGIWTINLIDIVF